MTVTILDVLGEAQRIETLLDDGVPVLDAELMTGEKPQVRSLGLLSKAAALCNDAILKAIPKDPRQYHAIGDPTEGAIVVAAAQLGLNKAGLDTRWLRIAEAPFTSERKRMTTVHQVNVAPSQTDTPWRDAPYWVGLLMGIISLGIGYWAWNIGRHGWQTMVFTTLPLSQMGHALAIRSGRDSFLTVGPLSNKPLLGAVLLAFVLQLAVIYVLLLHELFKTVGLPPAELATSLLLSTVVFCGMEAEKWLLRRRSK